MVRIVENNDWVMFSILGLGFVYLVIFNWLQKELSIKEFLLQEYAIAQNNFLSWVFISVVFIGVFSILFSQYTPMIPRFFGELSVLGYKMNKIGFFIVIMSGYHLLKIILSFFFYQAIGQGRKLRRLVFVAQKFFFVESLLLMILCLVHYYFPIDRDLAYFYYVGVLGVFFIGKILFYLFHREQPMPEGLYYKILYICTLQILPLLAVWKFIFL